MIKNFLKVITAWDTKKTIKNEKITRIFEKNGKKKSIVPESTILC
jgi:hypothetical protein